MKMANLLKSGDAKLEGLKRNLAQSQPVVI